MDNIINGIVCLICFLLIFIALNFQFVRTNYYQNKIRCVQKFINGVPYNLQIVNTGSSYGRYGLDYSDLDIRAFNLALQSQSLSYDFKILKQYINHLDKKCKVIITIVPLVFGFLDYSNDSRNTEYYYFLDKEKINGYSKFKEFTRIKFPVLSAKLRLAHLIKDQAFIDLYAIEDSKSRKEVEIEAYNRISGWKKQFKLENMILPTSAQHLHDMFNKTTTLLADMIEFCIENEFEPIILIPPVSGVLNELISKEFMEEVLYKNIRRANKRNIPVLDYLYDERFQDYRLYINSDFLNAKGRKLFTKVIMEEIVT